MSKIKPKKLFPLTGNSSIGELKTFDDCQYYEDLTGTPIRCFRCVNCGQMFASTFHIANYHCETCLSKIENEAKKTNNKKILYEIRKYKREVLQYDFKKHTI